MRATFAFALLLLLLTPAAAPAAERPEDDLGSLFTGLDLMAEGATPGVRVVRDGTRAFMVFDARAARRFRHLAGRRIAIDCGDVPAIDAQNVEHNVYERIIRAPKRREAFRAPLRVGTDTCSVGPAEYDKEEGEYTLSEVVASVALTEAGVTRLDRGPVARRITLAYVRALIRDVTRPFPATTELVRRAGGVTVALPGPDAPAPAAPAVGAWSNGTDQVVLKSRSPLGYELFVRQDGDLETKNTTFWL